MDRLRNALSKSKSKRNRKNCNATEVGEPSNAQQVEGQVEQPRVVRRPNWTETETCCLLNIVRELQLKRNRYEYSFTKTELNQMLESFKAVMVGTTIDQKRLHNRLKTLKSSYGVLKDLASKSGWGWNYESNELMYPSEEDLMEALLVGGDKMKNYSGNKFAYFSLMEIVCNPGRKAAGADEHDVYTIASGTGTHSVSGSSDDPGNGPTNLTDETTVQQPSRTTRTVGSQGRAQTSDSTPPASGGSSSQKRKSTDNGEDVRKVRTRLRPRDKFLEKIANVGEGILSKYDQLAHQPARLDEQLQCFKKMEALKIEGPAHTFCLKAFESELMRRFFLHSSDSEIFKWLQNNQVMGVPGNASTDIPPNPPPTAPGTPHSGFHNAPPENAHSYSGMLGMNYPYGMYNPSFGYPPAPPHN